MALSAGELWALHDLLQPVCSLADGWHLGLDYGGSRGTYDGSVQMIDTFIVRVHQRGGSGGGAETRLMVLSRGGLTTKIHACVDTNGMPVRLDLTAGEAHDNRLVTELLSEQKAGAILLADRGYDADWIRAFAGDPGAWA